MNNWTKLEMNNEKSKWITNNHVQIIPLPPPIVVIVIIIVIANVVVIVIVIVIVFICVQFRWLLNLLPSSLTTMTKFPTFEINPFRQQCRQSGAAWGGGGIGGGGVLGVDEGNGWQWGAMGSASLFKGFQRHARPLDFEQLKSITPLLFLINLFLKVWAFISPSVTLLYWP